MIIRRLMPEDAADWRAFRLEVLRETLGAIGRTYAAASARPPESFARWLARIGLFVTLANPRIVGAKGWNVLKGETAGPLGRIVSVFTNRTHHGKGLFDRLLNDAFSDAPCSVMQVELGVSSDNKTPMRTYQRNSFDGAGKTPAAVCHPGIFTDDFQMLKRLDA